MRTVLIAVMGIAAAVMGYFALQGECPGGKVFASEAECRAGGYGAQICHSGFAASDRRARLEYSPFNTETDCTLQFPRCMPHGKLAGYVPVPRGTCIVEGKPGEPVYERYGQRISPR
jgi:uncharacterized protein YgiB involved in biofilm formation